MVSVVASTGRDGNGEMQTQHDTIFVQGLPQSITEQAIAAHFGAIGIIKVVCRILVIVLGPQIQD